MSLSAYKINAFTKLIASLPDDPNASAGLTAQQVKEWFDSSPTELKTSINAVIDALVATTGAGEIGVTTIAGISGATVQAVLGSLKSYIDTQDSALSGQFAAVYEAIGGIVLGQIPDNTLTDFKMADNTLTETKMAASMKKQSGGVAPYDHILSNSPHREALEMIRSSKDSESLYTVVTYARADGTTFKVSTLSGGTTPRYTTRTVVFYDVDGTTPIQTVVYTLTYSGDDLVSEVIS